MTEHNKFVTFAELNGNRLTFDYTKELLQLTRKYYKLKLKTRRLQIKYVKRFLLMSLTNYLDKCKEQLFI